MATLKGPVIRDTNGVPHGDKWVAGSCYGELFIDDGTGFVSGSGPTDEIVDATPVKVGRLNGVGAVAAERAASTDGRLNIEQAGDYLVYGGGAWLGANNAVISIQVFKNGAAIADAASTPGGAIVANDVMPSAAVTTSWNVQGVLPGLNVGDYIQLAVTSNSGTVTIKKMRFGVRLLADNTSPVDNP